MIKNFLKLIKNEFTLMLRGSVFTIVLYSLLLIAASIFSLALRHVSFDIEIAIAFLWVIIFFISLIKVEKVYATDFSEPKLQQYILSPFALEIVVFLKNIMIYLNLLFLLITISKNNKLSITSVLTLPLFIPILIFSMALTDVVDFQLNKMYLFFVAYFLLNLAFSPLLTSFALKKLSV